MKQYYIIDDVVKYDNKVMAIRELEEMNVR